MANPRVRPDLHFYPEDTGKKLSQAWQAKHWLKDMDKEHLTPMVRLHNQDFFIFEPALLASGRACMPTQWFTRNGDLYAKAWSLQPVSREFDSGWQVEEYDEFEVPETDFLVSFKNWEASGATSGLPRATQILGIKVTNFLSLHRN